MKFDKKLLAHDVIRVANELSEGCNNDYILKNLAGFTALGEVLYNQFHLLVLPDYTLLNIDRVKKIIKKKDLRSIYELATFSNQNENTILGIKDSFCNEFDRLGIYLAPFKNEMRRYSEEEFKDLILSYFATYGNVPYRIVKKYFDEKRIQLKTIDVKSFDGGFYSWLHSLKTGFIFDKYEGLNTMSAWSLVHELGHAVDTETYLFTQDKKRIFGSDGLIEVPSASVELGFLDELIDNRIDPNGGRLLYNSRFCLLNKYCRSYEEAVSLDDLMLCPDGTAYSEKEQMALDELAMEARATGRDKELDDLYIRSYPFRDFIIYILGYWFALHINQIRKQDKEEAYKIMCNIDTQRYEHTLDESIALLGISKEDFISGKYVLPKIEEEHMALKRRYNL